MRRTALLFACLTALLLSSCGFQLRGHSKPLPYASLHIALPENAEIAIWLRRHIESSGTTRLVANPKEADAVLQQLYDQRQKSILSINAQGQVREYRLQVTYGFRIVDARGRLLVKPNEITVTRDMTYDASAVLAKEQEEALLWRDISQDVVSQLIRRLSIIKPLDPELPLDD